MKRYKESLGLGGSGKDLSDPNDPRHCIIISLTMNSEGRPPVTIDLSAKGSEATLKDKPFKIKEGVKFSMTATFKVQHEILSGLHYVQIVKRKGIRVSKDQEMIVSRYHSPQNQENLLIKKIGFICSKHRQVSTVHQALYVHSHCSPFPCPYFNALEDWSF